jgi:hypothetical protein
MAIPLVTFATAMLFAACGGDSDPSGPDNPPTPTGSINLSVTTSGDDVDTDGYQVTVDGAAAGSIQPNGNLSIPDIDVGSRTVALSGIALNCTPAPGASQTVNVAEDQATDVTFTVTCEPDQATLSLVTETTGKLPDLDGYTLVVDGGAGQTMDPNDTVEIPVSSGAHTVAITGQAANCVPDADVVRDVSAAFNQTTTVKFTVTCFEDPVIYSFADEVGAYLVAGESDGSASANLTDFGDIVLAFNGGGESLSPDGSHIVFQGAKELGDTDPPAFDIYISAFNKSEIRQLALADQQFFPSWSPDGQTILFAGFGSAGYGDIYTAPADFSSSANLTSSSSQWEFAPDWSPDGTQILFQSNDPDVQDDWVAVYVMDADGTNRTNVSDNDGGRPDDVEDVDPTWSPDGQQVAFGRYGVFDWVDDIYVVNADGSGIARITDSPEVSEFWLDWNDDGTEILYVTSPLDESGQDLYTVSPDGETVTRLTTAGNLLGGTYNEAHFPSTPHAAGDMISYLTFTPDFSRLGVWVMARDGSGAVEITDDTSGDPPGWSPGQGGSQQVRSYPTDTREHPRTKRR